jgi:agmatine/peptidylarginine deiminase
MARGLAELYAFRNKKLKPWDEVVATFDGLQTTDENVTLKLSIKKEIILSYPKSDKEAETIINTLGNMVRGTKIAILATDIPEKPLLVRILNEYSCNNTLRDIQKTNYEKPRILTSETQFKKDRKFEQKKQVPINYPDQTILQTLKNTPKGKKIAILRTDIPEKPILIQPLERSGGSHKNFLEVIAGSF